MSEQVPTNQTSLNTGDFSNSPSTEREVPKSIGSMSRTELEKAVLDLVSEKIEKYIKDLVSKKIDDVLLIKSLIIIKRKMSTHVYIDSVKESDRMLNELIFEAGVVLHEYANHYDVAITWYDNYHDVLLVSRICADGLIVNKADEQELVYEFNLIKEIKKQEEIENREKELAIRESELMKKENELLQKEKELEMRESEIEENQKKLDELRKRIAEVLGFEIEYDEEDP